MCRRRSWIASASTCRPRPPCRLWTKSRPSRRSRCSSIRAPIRRRCLRERASLACRQSRRAASSRWASIRMRWTRSWFLLLVLVGLLLAWLWPAAVQWTTYLQPTITGAVAVFLSAWAIETRRLVGAIARPIPALLAIGISYLVLPVLSWLGFFVIANADFRIGLLLITCVPCTLVSAVIWTRLGGGNEAVALLVTTLSNGLSWLITTGWLLLAAEVSQVSFDQTAGLMGQLIIVLVVPMLAGQLGRTVPDMAAFGERRQTLLAVTGRLMVLGIMLKAAVEVRSKLEGEGGDRKR